MRGTTDMTDVEEGGNFKICPEGTHIFRVEEVAEKITKNGDPMFLVTFVVASGEHTGCKVWDNIIIPEVDSPAIKIQGRTKHFLHCIEEPYEGKFDWNTDMWIGKATPIKVYHEMYEGKPKARVGEYILDEGSQEVTDAETVPF